MFIVHLGSTGKPVSSTRPRYYLGGCHTSKYTFDVHEDDVLFTAGDAGLDFSGHTYVVRTFRYYVGAPSFTTILKVPHDPHLTPPKKEILGNCRQVSGHPVLRCSYCFEIIKESRHQVYRKPC